VAWVTEQEIADLGPALASYLKRFRGCFPQKRVAAHFDTFCRGLLSDRPRKSVEPIASEAGTAVRTLREFLATTQWDHEQARARLQQGLAATLADLPGDDLGTVGVLDETSCQKWGDPTPGVQRQYLGCVGKIDNGIVTVHVGVAKGAFQALLDADLYLPEGWAADRERCRNAGIPDDVGYRSKWPIALGQLIRLHENGVRFDWLTFDEWYGSKAPLLWVLGLVSQKFVAEAPVNFTVRRSAAGRAWRADELQPPRRPDDWERFRIERKTQPKQVWRARGTPAWAAKGWRQLVTAINEATGELKYFVTNAVDEPLSRVLRVAFRRATIEHAFRLAKQEAGLMHDEGRQYVGLVRHLLMALVVLGFVAERTQRLRGEKPGGGRGTSVPSLEPTVWPDPQPTPRPSAATTPERSDWLSSTTQRPGCSVSQETAA
jgi:SRSO17 transposase